MTLSFPDPKDPDQRGDYLVDWASLLVDDETISTAVVTVNAPDGDDLELDGEPTVGDTSITFWLTGGTAGTVVPIHVRVTTNQARTTDRTFWLTVQDR